VYLRRMRNGVRSAPSEDRHRRPAFDSTLGVSTPADSDAQDAQDLRSRRTDQSCEQPSAASCRHHLLVVLTRILQGGPDHLSHPGSAPPTRPDGGGTASQRGHADGTACPRPQRPSRQHSLAPGQAAKRGTHHAGSDMRLAARGDGARVIEPQSRKDAAASDPTTKRRADLLSQTSQHLPFPFRNARVEVGRTVMEG
jgi:hypothetical protein